MIGLTFVIEYNREMGDKGARPENMPNADPYGGLACCHDLLEHFRDDDGSIAAEMQALGAMLYLRVAPGHHSYVDDDGSPRLRFEVNELESHCINEGFSLAPAPKTRRLDDTCEDAIVRCITAARHELAIRDRGPLAEEHREMARQEFGHWLVHHVPGWLRVGYRRAERRYRNVPDWYSIWSAAEEMIPKIDRFIRHAEIGDRFRLTFDKRRIDLQFKPLRNMYDR